MGVRRSAALLALTVLACDAPTVPSAPPGYDPRLVGTQLVYRWPLGHTLSVYAHTAGAPSGFDLPAAILRANELWAEALNYREFDVRLVGTPAEADVVFHFDTDSVVSVGSCTTPPGTGAGGATSFCTDDQLTTIVGIPLVGGGASGVKFDVQISTSPVRIPNVETFQRIVAHEFGHVVGIGRHSDDADDLMFTAPAVDAPSPADVQALRWVLDQPADLRP